LLCVKKGEPIFKGTTSVLVCRKGGGKFPCRRALKERADKKGKEVRWRREGGKLR